MQDTARTGGRGLWTALILGALAGASIAAYRARRRQQAMGEMQGSSYGSRADVASSLRRQEGETAGLAGSALYRGDGSGGSTLPTGTGAVGGPSSTVL
ncbi:hypothetical protein [Schlegelella aquatica]|uniref:hypothetical protein n=1 Tax=Caldimonas aquatica TaxID=376175 RepID=UPI0037523B05